MENNYEYYREIEKFCDFDLIKIIRMIFKIMHCNSFTNIDYGQNYCKI